MRDRTGQSLNKRIHTTGFTIKNAMRNRNGHSLVIEVSIIITMMIMININHHERHVKHGRHCYHGHHGPHDNIYHCDQTQCQMSPDDLNQAI